MDILLLCTANQCRSPMAEALLRHHLAEVGVAAEVSSAGLMEGGRPATQHGIEAMADRGLDTTGHRSRQVSRELVEEADLIVGMAREHVREVAMLSTSALDRAFTLKELVRLGAQAGRRRPDEELAGWLRRVAASRDRQSLLGVGHDPANDVEDPIGRGRDDYEVTARELDELLGRLVDIAFSPAPEHVS